MVGECQLEKESINEVPSFDLSIYLYLAIFYRIFCLTMCVRVCVCAL